MCVSIYLHLCVLNINAESRPGVLSANHEVLCLDGEHDQSHVSMDQNRERKATSLRKKEVEKRQDTMTGRERTRLKEI